MLKSFIKKLPILNRIFLFQETLKKENEELKERIKYITQQTTPATFDNIFLSPWSDTWKEFYVNHYAEISSLFEKLKNNLDALSNNVIDTFWEKIIYLIPYNRYKKSFLYKISDFFTPTELQEQHQTIDLAKYKIPEGVNIEKAIFMNKCGSIFLPNDILPQIKNRDIIDGGAYCGDSALVLCDYEPSQIYSFEPLSTIFNKLTETITLNNKENIIRPVKYALSDRIGVSTIYGDNSGASIVSDNEKRGVEKIQATTIDMFAKENNLNIGMIKLDVEGSESAVIQGAIETIKKDKPILLISIYHRPEDFFYIKPMIESLNLGYTFMVRKTSPFRVTSETVLIGYVNNSYAT